MKILFVSSIFPDADHPARGTFNYEMCSALQRLGHEVRVVAPQAWTEVLKKRLIGKQTLPTSGILQNKLSVEYPVYWYPPKLGRSWYGTCFWYSIRNSIQKMMKDWSPDLVLSYWVHPDGEAGMRLACQRQIPCAVIVGGSDVLLITNSASRKEQVVRVLKNTDAVLTVSQGLAEVVQRLGASAQQTFPVYQGIDAAKFCRGDRAQARLELGLEQDLSLAVWVGRMVPVKNLEMLLDAAAIRAEQDSKFVVCLLGDGPERPKVEQLIREKKLEKNVRLIGSVGHDKLPNWYRAADVVLLCSHSEGLPNVLREAVACGTPFVSTDVGSISEIADPACSLLVRSGDSEKFAEGIGTVLQGDYGQNVLKMTPRTWEDMALELETIFTELTGTRQKTVDRENNDHRQGCRENKRSVDLQKVT